MPKGHLSFASSFFAGALTASLFVGCQAELPQGGNSAQNAAETAKRAVRFKVTNSTCLKFGSKYSSKGCGTISKTVACQLDKGTVLEVKGLFSMNGKKPDNLMFEKLVALEPPRASGGNGENAAENAEQETPALQLRNGGLETCTEAIVKEKTNTAKTLSWVWQEAISFDFLEPDGSQNKKKPASSVLPVHPSYRIPLHSKDIVPKGIFTSGFGWRWNRPHRGIDIAAPTGTPIKALCDGVVVTAGWNRWGFGNLVEIRHDADDCNKIVKSLYAHAYKIKTRVGLRVKRGQTVATVGSTGQSTGPHLHLEVVEKGKGTVNPMGLLGDAINFLEINIKKIWKNFSPQSSTGSPVLLSSASPEDTRKILREMGVDLETRTLDLDSEAGSLALTSGSEARRALQPTAHVLEDGRNVLEFDMHGQALPEWEDVADDTENIQ